MNSMRGRMLLPAALLLLAAYRPATAQGVLTGAGATFPEPIYSKWFAKFKQAANVTIDYQSVGSGAGIKQIQNKSVDFAASDAPLSSSEEGAMPGPVAHIPTVGGAVVLTYNIPGIGSGLRFTPEVIAGIYLGQIKKWNDTRIKAVNPSVNLPDMAVQPVYRSDGSGTTYIFTSYLKKVSKEWAGKIGAGKSVNWPGGLSGKGNPGVAATVRRTPGSVGYVELAFAINEKLAYGSVKNRAGNFVAPSAESVTYALGKYIGVLKQDIKTPTVDAPGVNSYPISGLTYILVLKSSGPKTGPLTKLLSWVMQNEQQDMARGLYYAPLPNALRQLNLAILKAIPGSQASAK